MRKKNQIYRFIKNNSEGHEEFILKVQKIYLKNRVNVIYLEILSKNNFNLKKKKILNFLKNYGFKLIKEYPIKSVSILK